MKELVIQYIYAFLSNNGYSMTAAVLAVECRLDQSLLQTTPPGDDLETIVTNYRDHKIPTTPQIIIPPVKRTRKKNWIITEPHISSITMATPINSFERKRPHDTQMSGSCDPQMTGSHDHSTDQPYPPVSKRLCPSPRKSGTPRKHNATPPISSCDLVDTSSEEPGPSNQGDVQLPGNSDIVDMELLQSVINDSQLPQQLANSINAALQSVNNSSIATGGSHDTVETSDNLVDRILENTQSDLFELLTELLPHDDND